MRDPFMIRSPQGDKFFLLGTDLKAHGNGSWHRSVIEGSRSILIWESNDLIHWSEQRMVEVAPPDAGCAWAPEAIYDADSEQYLVYWASMLGDKESEGSEGRYHRMLAARTRDFVNFSEPEVYIDYGLSVIDTTMIRENGKIYRFSKREKISHVFQESGDSIFDTSFTLVQENIGQEFMKHGEGPIVFKSNVEDKWYLFIDEYGLRGYIPLETTDLDSGEWTMPANFALQLSRGMGPYCRLRAPNTRVCMPNTVEVEALAFGKLIITQTYSIKCKHLHVCSESCYRGFENDLGGIVCTLFATTNVFIIRSDCAQSV